MGLKVELPVLVPNAASPAGAGIIPDHTVAEVVRRFPEAVTVFARHHMDACCGGRAFTVALFGDFV